MNKEIYSGGAIITGLLAFAAVWVYAMSQWGLLFGLIFGWIPALIAGFVAGVIWPIVMLLIIVGVIYFHQQEIESAKRSYEYHARKCMTTKGNEAVQHCQSATRYLQEHPDWKLDETGQVSR